MNKGLQNEVMRLEDSKRNKEKVVITQKTRTESYDHQVGFWMQLKVRPTIFWACQGVKPEIVGVEEVKAKRLSRLPTWMF